MKVDEIVSGELINPNIPEFNDPSHVCDMDGYQIMQDTWKGVLVFGILLPDNTPKSYLILEPEKEGKCTFREIYTLPEFRGSSLGAILLLAMKGKLGISLVLDKAEVVSDDARSLIQKMTNNGRIHPRLLDGTLLSPAKLKRIFAKFADDTTIIIEGHEINQPKFNKDRVIAERWYIRSYTGRERYDL